MALADRDASGRIDRGRGVGLFPQSAADEPGIPWWGRRIYPAVESDAARIAAAAAAAVAVGHFQRPAGGVAAR